MRLPTLSAALPCSHPSAYSTRVRVRVSAANAAAWTPFLARRTLSRSCVAFLALGIHSAHRRRASPAYSQPVRTLPPSSLPAIPSLSRTRLARQHEWKLFKERALVGLPAAGRVASRYVAVLSARRQHLQEQVHDQQGASQTVCIAHLYVSSAYPQSSSSYATHHTAKYTNTSTHRAVPSYLHPSSVAALSETTPGPPPSRWSAGVRRRSCNATRLCVRRPRFPGDLISSR
ncbi:hypothetical protein OH76DRAFT_506029 [Lentinus brumalis]|uniref:Uncharacterized protein n=1 Tax=Lentinus brumalis TaxID=2498619 RepID=A0A371CHZ0_9APHY|nr:hypothetical protein OH76DRAFT_506029 [Polyporus brumalis]